MRLDHAALSLPIAAQFLRCRGTIFFGYSGAFFGRSRSLFSSTTAAQNIHIFPRKSPLCRSHFFEWLKTAISSNACGMSTLKSPLLRESDAPRVHPRLRKRLARCTLDCGFKTSESPALRGFVAERGPITGTSLYLVLKSNGLHRPKIRLKKFGFSPKIVPANISKKLPAQVLSQIVFHPVFQPLAQMAHVCLHSESGYTLGFRRKIAHNGSHGETRGVSDGGWYHYPRTVPHVHKHPRAGYQNGKFCRFWGLVGGTPKERRKPSEQRCAYARRCSEASRPRWAA